MPSKKLLYREIENGRMLKNNGSWMYCNQCDNTIGYLCYSTYQTFEFKSKCSCGNVAKFKLGYFEDEYKNSCKDLKLVKNRYCCPHDDSPLFSVVNKNIESYYCKVVCNECNTSYISGNMDL
ncbi:hypothetical protein [Marinisporobacter balticus]|uniref:Uncharacterized protein n=1 Tax=Marinisporobacter balticus TaxID=2018667 RepID=A0A4V2S9X2_9FIRM|nr:hypothetical protein [Marinisporobacter balticus]TCO69000.1 hypothetical protein EV214_13626 [Marinisporobacter balticus]